MKAEGELLASQQIRLEGVAPGATTELQLELPSLDGRETFVQLRVIKASATRYSAAEHELGQYQFQLKASTRQLQPFANPNATALQIADERLALTLSGSGFALRFSRLDGKLVSWQQDGNELIERSPRLTFFADDRQPQAGVRKPVAPESPADHAGALPHLKLAPTG